MVDITYGFDVRIIKKEHVRLGGGSYNWSHPKDERCS